MSKKRNHEWELYKFYLHQYMAVRVAMDEMNQAIATRMIRAEHVAETLRMYGHIAAHLKPIVEKYEQGLRS